MNAKPLTLTTLALLLFTSSADAAETDNPPIIVSDVEILEEVETLAETCFGGKELRIFSAIAEYRLGTVDADGAFHVVAVLPEVPHVGSVITDSEACSSATSSASLRGPVTLGWVTGTEPPITPAFRIYDLWAQDTLLIVCVLDHRVKVATALATYDVGYRDTEDEYNSIFSIRNVPFVATSIMDHDCGS